MSDWLMTLGTARPRYRLIALPHAGGWPSAFHPWRQVLPEGVELRVAQLPGRGPRAAEPPLRQVEPIVEGLAQAVAELAPLPYTVLGHSFGSVLGYELTRLLEQKGLPPRLLVVSARQPPCFPNVAPFTYHRSDAELLEHLVRLGGISADLASRSGLVRNALAAIRADLEAMERYQRPMSGTSVPIVACGAEDDPVVISERLHLWSLETTGDFDRRMYSGGHFYLYDEGNAAAIARRIIPREFWTSMKEKESS